MREQQFDKGEQSPLSFPPENAVYLFATSAKARKDDVHFNSTGVSMVCLAHAAFL